MRKKNSLFQKDLSLPSLLTPVAVVLMLAYGAYVSYPLAAGPELSASWQEQQNGGFIISGTAKRISLVSINDFPIALSDQGTFAVERTYPPGYTVVTVHAEDRFGRTREKTLTLVNSHYTQYGSKENNQEESSSENSTSSNGNEGG